MANKSQVWIPDVDAVWVKGDVGALSGVVDAAIEGGETRKVDVEALYKKIGYVYTKGEANLPLRNKNIGESGIDDMCNLDYLHEAAVLNNLRVRFAASKPYTYTGPTCIAINPYKWITEIFTPDLRRQFLIKSREQLMPHAYASSARAFTEMHMQRMNQSILVSGESGAGKTETVKILMNHLAAISKDQERNKLADDLDGNDGEDDQIKMTEMQQDSTIRKILQANPLLEAFGNAKTSRNDNSSRFGKFVQLQFDFRSCLVGAHTNTYLLEKSRVVWQSGGERNYHIFHQLLATGDKEKQTLKLCKAVSEYRYTKNAIAAASIEGVSDKDNFTKIKGAMKTLGVEPLAQAFLYRLLSGLLNLGQVSFVDAGDSERSEVNPDTSADLVLASSLLGIEPDMLSLTLTSRQLITRNGASVTRVPMNKAAALNGLDATAKNLFVKVFDWLVEKINGTINADPKEVETHIGLLDIFGFESFQHNSFEQLCINYTNETLQQKFCQDVFKSVQSEYEAEGIPLNSVAFADNQPVLDMIESRMGILSLLNEECLRPQGSDKSFASKITQQFVTKDSPMKRDRKSDMCFTIVHYAESVTYDAEGWCDKNKDTLIEDMVKQLEKSTSSFVKQLFAPKPAIVAQVAAKKEGGRRGGAQRRGSTLAVNTVALQFRNQLKTLMTTIRTTNVQYVRCIKPNPNKSPTEYDPKMVVEQLRSAGVVDSIRISRAAYPNRMLSADFKLRFKVLASSEAKSHETLIAALVKKYCSKMTVKDDRYYEFGKTKIFFVKGVLELFEDARLEKLSMAVVDIQRMLRGRKARKAFKQHKLTGGKIVTLQAWSRCCIRYKRYHAALRATLLLQSKHRGKKGREKAKALRAQKLKEAAEAEAKAKIEAAAKAEIRKTLKAAAEAAALKATTDAKAKAAAVQAAQDAAAAEEADNKAQAEAAKLHAETVAQEEQKKAAAAKEAAEKLASVEAAKAAVEASTAKQKAEEEAKKAMPSMAEGLEYEVEFAEGPLGIWFTGDTVTELQAGGQGQKLGVLEGSCVLSIAGQPLKSVWEVSSMVTSATRPLKIRFKKPGLRQVRHRRDSAVDFRELEYDVEFDDGPLGIELDIKLSVKCLAPGGQAQKGGVRVGSNMVAVASVPVANIQELATAMKNASKPVTIRFRRKRRKKRKYAQQQSPAVKAEMEKKEKDYLQWLYGKAGSTNTSTVYRAQMDKSTI